VDECLVQFDRGYGVSHTVVLEYVSGEQEEVRLELRSRCMDIFIPTSIGGKVMHKFISSLGLSILLLSGNSWGATYYVNQTGGSDANNGLSTGSAWKTMAKVNASSFLPGDSILFKKGETWRETLMVPSSGIAGRVITFGAYGSGDAPIIDGSDIVTGWTDGTSNIWIATVTTKPNQVFFNGTRGTEAANRAGVNGANKWWWDSNVLYAYSTSDADMAFTNPGIEASKRDWCGAIIEKSYIYVNGLDCRKSNTYGFAAQAWGNGTTVAGIKWDNVTVTNSGRDGFKLENGASANTDNIIIIRSTSSYNGGTGFLGANLKTGSNRITIENSTFHHNGQLVDTYAIGVWNQSVASNTYLTVKNCEVYAQKRLISEGAGIQFDGNPTRGNIAEYNYVHDNEGGGIHSGYGGSDSNIVRYNLIVNNNNYGIAGYGGTNETKIYNNTIYGSVSPGGYSGIYLFTAGVYSVKNNVVVGNYNYGIDGNSGTTITCTNNLFYGYLTAATHNVTCTSSVTSGPLFVSTVTRDFHLQAGSPAIDAGTGVGLTRDFSGNIVPFGSAPDIGAYEYTLLKIPKSPSNLIISP